MKNKIYFDAICVSAKPNYLIEGETYQIAFNNTQVINNRNNPYCYVKMRNNNIVQMYQNRFTIINDIDIPALQE